MSGSVTKKGNRWYVIIEQRDPQTGERRRKWHSGFRTKREAEAARASLVTALNRGTYVPPSDASFDEYAEAWLRSISPTVRPSTLASYSLQIRRASSRIGRVPLQKVTAEHLDRLYADLLSDGREREDGGLSPSSVRRVHATLHRLFRDAAASNRIPRNPADHAHPPRNASRSGRFRVWDSSQLAQFLSHSCEPCSLPTTLEDPIGLFSETRLYPAYVLAATTGMRRGEVLGLRWDAVDLAARRISVTRTLITVGHEVHESEPKTKRAARRIAVDHSTAEILRRHAGRQADEMAQLGELWRGGDHVFTDKLGRPVHPNAFTLLFNEHRTGAMLPAIRLHDLRHTHATLALKAGHNPKVVSERLGHSSVAFTLDTYSHVVPGLQEDLAESLAASILNPPVEIR